MLPEVPSSICTDLVEMSYVKVAMGAGAGGAFVTGVVVSPEPPPQP